MTNGKICQKLVSRNLTQVTFPPRSENDEWVVWLFAHDDPGLGVFVGQGAEYDEAAKEAFLVWDTDQKEAIEVEEKKADTLPAAE